ncbi:hypothetical protein RB595_001459 [Gaeumannomyces hyphopodioides]
MAPMPPRAPAGYNPGPPPLISQGDPKRQRRDTVGNQPPPAPLPFWQPSGAAQPNPAPLALPSYQQLNPGFPPPPPPFQPAMAPARAPTPAPVPAQAPIPLHMHFKAMAAHLAANKQAAPPGQLSVTQAAALNPLVPAAAAPGQFSAGRVPVFNPPLPAAVPAGPIAQLAQPGRPTQVLATGAGVGPLHPYPINPRLIAEMQKKSDLFFEYRRGRGFAWKEEGRRSEWQALKLPVGFHIGNGRELTSANSKMFQGVADADQMSKNYFRVMGDRKLKEKNKGDTVKPHIRKVINDHSGDLLAAGARFVRLLGAGGHGAACLYEITNRQTGARRRIVVKMSLRGNDMKNEKTVMSVHEMLGNEEHGNPEVPLRLHQLPFDAETVTAINKVDAAQSLLIQIFSDRGALDRMVALLARLRIPARDKFCWHLLECLVRGCIAMWSPVRKQALARQQTVPNWPPLIQEELPPTDENFLSNFVHFDLDPFNIFMTNDVDHPIMPMAQIGDFGTTRPMHKDRFREDDFTMWSLRHTGKMGYMAPEQFTDQWDYVYVNPWKQLGRPNYKFRPWFEYVAGNYGMWTNIWAIGITMWVVITQRSPMHPPVPKEIPVLPKMDADPGGTGRRTFWTYAYPLHEPGHFEIGDELRHLVVRMMANEPCDRPSLEELLEAAEAGCAAADDGDPAHEQTDLETDANIKAYFEHYFDQIDPPPPDPAILDPAKPLPSPPPVPGARWHMPPPAGAGGVP